MILEAVAQQLDPAERLLRFAAWKALLWQQQQQRLGAPQLRWAGARALIDARYACTGVSAGWCPICGDCICDRECGPFDDPDCPLHAGDSPHAEGVTD